MPYNTRRKSLSLPALGIQLPQASRAHRASISKPAPTETSAPAASSSEIPPAKRVKRAHRSSSPVPLPPPSSSTPSLMAPVKSVTFADRPRSSGGNAVYEHTPPPSPGRAEATRIDVEGIKDDIVAGVVEQLEKTGNRPHLIKELATVLSTTNTSVSNSANPAALLSSRLASYMRRPRSATSPCLIAKELIPVHPRKVFYYLTTTPRQEMPTTFADPLTPGGRGPSDSKRIISPSLSNASQDDDEDVSMVEDRRRAALSPSPEVDLSYEADEGLADFPTPGSTLSSQRASMARDGHEPERDLGLNQRAESPPLEGDEREFTDTARGMRLRGLSGSEADVKVAAQQASTDADGRAESEEEPVQTNSDAVRTLFGPHNQHAHGHLATGVSGEGVILSSPMIKPAVHSETLVKTEPHTAELHEVAMAGETTNMDIDDMFLGLGEEIGRPENMELDELDDFFEGF